MLLKLHLYRETVVPKQSHKNSRTKVFFLSLAPERLWSWKISAAYTVKQDDFLVVNKCKCNFYQKWYSGIPWIGKRQKECPTSVHTLDVCCNLFQRRLGSQDGVYSQFPSVVVLLTLSGAPVQYKFGDNGFWDVWTIWVAWYLWPPPKGSTWITRRKASTIRLSPLTLIS